MTNDKQEISFCQAIFLFFLKKLKENPVLIQQIEIIKIFKFYKIGLKNKKNQEGQVFTGWIQKTKHVENTN